MGCFEEMLSAPENHRYGLLCPAAGASLVAAAAAAGASLVSAGSPFGLVAELVASLAAELAASLVAELAASLVAEGA